MAVLYPIRAFLIKYPFLPRIEIVARLNDKKNYRVFQYFYIYFWLTKSYLNVAKNIKLLERKDIFINSSE